MSLYLYNPQFTMRFPPQSPVISPKAYESSPQEADRYAPFPLQSFGALFGILIELLFLSSDCEWFSSGTSKLWQDVTEPQVKSTIISV